MDKILREHGHSIKDSVYCVCNKVFTWLDGDMDLLKNVVK